MVIQTHAPENGWNEEFPDRQLYFRGGTVLAVVTCIQSHWFGRLTMTAVGFNRDTHHYASWIKYSSPEEAQTNLEAIMALEGLI